MKIPPETGKQPNSLVKRAFCRTQNAILHIIMVHGKKNDRRNVLKTF